MEDTLLFEEIPPSNILCRWYRVVAQHGIILGELVVCQNNNGSFFSVKDGIRTITIERMQQILDHAAASCNWPMG